MFDQYFERFELASEITEALKKCKCIAYAETKEELEEMAYGPDAYLPLRRGLSHRGQRHGEGS